ncbi:MAG: adenylosuccinate synthase, partial [Bryobacterales bacterium]|nr:adenylosuccinate synthase [Bryobacterales bacterium]
IVTKLDVLDHLAEIPVCVGYRAGGAEVTEMPATTKGIEALEPVYESVAGWRTPTNGIASFGELPEEAKAYLKFLESKTGVEVGCVSTGPERNQTMVVPGSRLEQLLGNGRS